MTGDSSRIVNYTAAGTIYADMAGDSRALMNCSELDTQPNIVSMSNKDAS
jgi:hypothetical protein